MMIRNAALVMLWSLVNLVVFNPSLHARQGPWAEAEKDFLIEGSFRGGASGTGFSLLSLKRVYSRDGRSERLVLEIGDKDGKVYFGQPGYFHAQLQKKPARLSLDLSQLLKSNITQDQLKTLFRRSKLVRTVELNPDLEDQSTNLLFSFRVPVKMRIFTLSPEAMAPKVVIDLTRK
jgi:hypothetical protein